MSRYLLPLLLTSLLNAAAPEAAAPLSGFPFTDEALTYTISWPTGLGLGEAHMVAKSASTGWNFSFTLDAAIPGFAVRDKYTASSNTDFCSSEFTRDFEHGPKKGGEKESIDRAHASVSRETNNGGGKSEFSVADCTKDALTFLYYARRELGQGRVPAAQRILLGGLYDISLSYAGAQNIQVTGKSYQTDKMVCTVKGATSSFQFDAFFARDAARTPLLVTVPLPVGKFSMELVR